MALQRTHVLLLLLLLTLLGLGLVQPSYGQDRMYQRFLRQHVDPDATGGNDAYCNLMMQRRKMTSHYCKRFNTFIHEDIWNIRSICSTSNIQCKNGQMNCHEGVVKVTDCRRQEVPGLPTADTGPWPALDGLSLPVRVIQRCLCTLTNSCPRLCLLCFFYI
uniref:Ribonuclease 4 n=1 Tax=Sus scrofa TaxID=9823 RepID=A0A5G2R2I5_PIG